MIYNLGDIIKHHRNTKNLTQAQLAEGICSRQTINKLEMGERRPHKTVLEEIFLKLGLTIQDFDFGIEIEDEQTLELLKLRERVKVAVAGFDLEALGILDAEIDTLFSEDKNSREDKLAQFLRHHVRINLNLPPSKTPNLDLSMEHAVALIKLYREDFELNQIDSYYLTIREYNTISTIATIHGYRGDFTTALRILNQLKTNYEQNQQVISTHGALNVFYTNLLVNLGVTYKISGDYDACLTQSIQNMELFKKHNDMKAFSRALYQRAFSLMKLGNTGEGKVFYHQFFMLASVLDGWAGISLPTVLKEYRDQFGDKFPEVQAWGSL